jgi:hypothetical protein
MQQHAVRFPNASLERIRAATKRKGFASASGFSPHGFIQEWPVGTEPMWQKAEGCIEGTHGSITTVPARQHTFPRALFAFAGAPAKTGLTGISELFHAGLRCIDLTPGGDE